MKTANEINNILTFGNKDFIEFPNELNKKCTDEEFHEMMTSHNSDIPINKVKFLDCSNINMGS